jgi:hypothetical protein
MPKYWTLAISLSSICACTSAPTTRPTCPCGESARIVPPIVPARSAHVEQLAQQRVTRARERLELLRLLYRSGHLSLPEIVAAHRDVAVAARDSGLHGQPLLAALTEYNDAATKLVTETRSWVDAGKVSESDLKQAELESAEAAYWLSVEGERGHE